MFVGVGGEVGVVDLEFVCGEVVFVWFVIVVVVVVVVVGV